MLRRWNPLALFSRQSLLTQELLHWCIINTGSKNVYIASLKSQLLPLGISFRLRFPTSKNFFIRQKLNSLQENRYVGGVQANKYAYTEAMVKSTSKTKDFLTNLLALETVSPEESRLIYTHFINLMDLASGYNDQRLAFLACLIWKLMFEKNQDIASISELQQRFLAKRSILVHHIINYAIFDHYQQTMGPFFESPMSIEPQWADVLATTFQFQYEDGSLTYNKSRISSYLGDSSTNSIESRRALLAAFLNKGLLTSHSITDRYSIIQDFIEHLKKIGDGSFLFTEGHHSIYLKSLRLLNSNLTLFTTHIDHMKTLINCDTSFQNYLTSSMLALAHVSPSICIDFWHRKLELTDNLSYVDLKCAMVAYSEMNLPRKALMLYRRHPKLHHDDQIHVLLRISEALKDYTLLQKQFEDMYGRGQLPHVGHYGLVMNALAEVGADKEVNNLHHQLLKRKLVPSTAVYAALVNSCLYKSDVDGAMEFVAKSNAEADVNASSASNAYASAPVNETPHQKLIPLVIDYYIRTDDFDAAYKLFHQTVGDRGANSIGREILNKIIDFAVTSYHIQAFEELREFIQKHRLDSESLAVKVARGYTRFGKYESADVVISEAHALSDVPFASAEVFKAQLRNFRFWLKNTSSRMEKKTVKDRAEFILRRFKDKRISMSKNHGLYGEVIKYYLSCNDDELALKCLEEAAKRDLLSEHHFIPFLRKLSRSESMKSSSSILEFYRKMVKANVRITAHTYVYLMKALIKLDIQSQNGLKNSFELLKSVFELHGLSLGNKEVKTPHRLDISHYCIELSKIVFSYVSANNSSGSFDILVGFLSQMRRLLGARMTSEFRLVLYLGMGKLYQSRGNSGLAESLANSGLSQLSATILRYSSELHPNGGVPPSLQLQYRAMMELKLKAMALLNKDINEYLVLLRNSLRDQVRLDGRQYVAIVSKVIAAPNHDSLATSFTACEGFLVAGNWTESKIMRKLQYLYKLTVVYYIRTVGAEYVETNFGILNRFYDVLDLTHLERQFRHVTSPLITLARELDDYNSLVYREARWSVDDVLQYTPEFFVPERRIASENRIPATLLSALWHAFTRYCYGDKLRAFKMMDLFPDTIGYLLYNGPSRLRLMAFRREVDKIEPPPKSDQLEDLESRRRRSIKALDSMMREQLA